MEKDVEEGEEDEEEVNKYVHTFLDEEDEIHKSKKANVSRANHQASSVKTSSARASSITVFMYIYSHCMGGGGGDYIRTYVHFRGRAQGCGSVQEHRTKHSSITYIHNWWHYNATSPPQHFAFPLHKTDYKCCNTTRQTAQDDGSTSC